MMEADIDYGYDFDPNRWPIPVFRTSTPHSYSDYYEDDGGYPNRNTKMKPVQDNYYGRQQSKVTLPQQK